MNRSERLKISALRHWAGRPGFHGRFISAMVAIRDHEPGTVLSAGQKYALDCCVFHYRRQLAGDPLYTEIIVWTQPDRAEYEAAHAARVAAYNKNRPVQAALF